MANSPLKNIQPEPQYNSDLNPVKNSNQIHILSEKELSNIDKINAKYDAELKALEGTKVSESEVKTELEDKKADIERRRQEARNRVDKAKAHENKLNEIDYTWINSSNPNDKIQIIDHVELPENHRNIGLGLSLYILKGEELISKGKILVNQDGMKESAWKVWNRLADLGLATRTGEYATFQYVGLKGLVGTPEGDIEERRQKSLISNRRGTPVKHHGFEMYTIIPSGKEGYYYDAKGNEEAIEGENLQDTINKLNAKYDAELAALESPKEESCWCGLNEKCHADLLLELANM